ncbi:MAG: AEC family transporter [Geminicoccaceae bacterium]
MALPRRSAYCDTGSARAQRARERAFWGAAPITVVIEIIAPIFGIVLAGWLAARLRAFDEAATRGLSLFAFNFAIPVFLLRTVAQTELPPQPEWDFVLAYFTGAFTVFALGALVARLLFARGGAMPAIFGITACFSNTTILGIPIVLRAFGEAAAVPLALILAFHSALLFTLTTVVAEIGAGIGVPLRHLLRNVGRGLVTNPILWGIAGGLLLNFLDLALPAMLDQLAAMLGSAALPTALFALGSNLARFHLARTIREALVLIALKNLIQPTIIYALGAWVFGLAPVSLAVATTMAALPTGINAYLFGARYNAATAEASSTILISTLVSAVSIGLLLALWR